ncbi:MAG: hypothetical protein ACPGWR_02500, partial [Ardenticatenaceae bacterium]
YSHLFIIALILSRVKWIAADQTGRALLRRTLNMAQGHPKLLELADKMATNGQLAALSPANSAQQLRLDAFFRTGESQQSPQDFIATLRHWTTTLTATLPPTARLLFHFLCRLEEEDRVSHIIETMWPYFLERLKKVTPIAATVLKQANFELDSSFASLTNTGLIEPNTDQSPLTSHQLPVTGMPAGLTLYRIHPAIAETGRDEADLAVLKAADLELGKYFMLMYEVGLQMEMEMEGGTPLVVGAHRAVPYLLRSERWAEAGTLLERMIQRDQTPATLAFALPLLRQIADVTQDTDFGLEAAGILTTALLLTEPDVEAEQMARQDIDKCVAQGNYRSASVAAGQLINLLRMMGRYDEALEVAEQMADYTRRAELGPWSQLLTEIQWLQILSTQGHYDQVLQQILALRPQLATLPSPSAANENESAIPWNVIDGMLDTGRNAAQQLEKWPTALEFNAELLAYQQKRGANEVSVARTRLNDYFPLLRLRRYAEARALLMHCRTVFEQNHEMANLGKAFTALADLENEVRNRAAAVQFEQSALRYHYQAGESGNRATSHNNLANYLERCGAAANLVLAHRLASAVIRVQSGAVATLAKTVRKLANSPMPASPPTFDEVVATVELTEGVRFRGLFARLPKRAPNGDAAIAAVWEMAKKRWSELEQERAKREQAKKVLDVFLSAIESGDSEKVVEALMQLPPSEQQAVAAYAQLLKKQLEVSPEHR